MNTPRFLIFSLFLLCFSLLFQACGKSRLVTSWMDTNKTGYQINKVLVIAVFKDPITQKIYESSFVNLLKKEGVQAYAGSDYRLGPEEPHKKAIVSALQKTGATSVLITHILSDTSTTYTVAPLDDSISYFTYWDSPNRYHRYVYEQAFAPAETIEKRYERMAATLFGADTGKAIWSATSESVNFEKRLRVDDEQLEELFINDMKKKKIL